MKWKNKQKVLILCSRGVTHQHRFLYNDILRLIPHAKKESKIDKTGYSKTINVIAELHGCTTGLYFEARRKMLNIWALGFPDGPSVKFYIHNIHTSGDLSMTGNSILYSRPVITFDANFNTPHLKLVRELLMQIFSTPEYHPKSKPFIDHAISFSVAEERLWFRHYQIAKKGDLEITEIGPRFTLCPLKILASSVKGEVIWRSYEKPNKPNDTKAFADRQSKKVRKTFTREDKIMKQLKTQIHAEGEEEEASQE